MRTLLLVLIVVSGICVHHATATADEPFTTDVFETSQGDLKITFIGHGSLMVVFGGKTIHIDPFGRLADYSKLPDADIVFITHQHRDHLDEDALREIRKDDTVIVLTKKCAENVEGGVVMENGDVKTIDGLRVEAVPAYNLVHKREDGQFFHPKGEGNGYVITFGDKRLYVAGDTENTPEMKALKNIDYAFLPMNLPYTMTPEMVADAAIAFKPRVLYPYHYGKTDPEELVELLKDHDEIEVRIRNMP
jgi:L-ascorbate metabolism protein UlaG (beta-lactamase superfamily)